MDDQRNASGGSSASSQTSADSRRSYLALFNSIDQGFCTIDVAFDPNDRPTDYRFVEVSPSFARQTGIEHGAGRWMRQIAPDQDAHWLEIYGSVSLTGEAARFERQSTPLGRWCSVHAFRIEDQPRGQIGVLFNDITEQKRGEDYHAFLLKLSDALRPLADPEEVQAVTADLLGAHLRVNHCHYAEVRGAYVNISHSYADGLPPMTGSFRADDFGKRLMDGYRAGRLQVCVDTATDPLFSAEERQMLKGARIGSYIGVPLIKDGEWNGTFGVQTIEPREWTPSEVALVQEVAERTWATVQHAGAAKALRESEEKYRTLFDSIDEGFLVVEVLFDDEGKAVDHRFLEVNPAHERLTGMPSSVVGKRVRELVPNLKESVVERLGRVALTGVPIRFEDYVSGMDRWFDVYLSRVGGEGSRTVACVFTNITERKRRERHAAFLDKLSQALVLLDSPEEIVRAVGEALEAHLDVGFVHVADVELDHGDEPAEARISMVCTWEREGLVKAGGTYRAGDYLSEEFLRAARAGEPIVTRDSDTDPRVDTEAYRAIGIRGAVAVPILKDGAWPGFIAVCTPGPRDWRPDEVTLIVETAHRLFPRIERVRAEQALRSADQRKDEFLATLAHELRNPMAAISMALSLIESSGGDPIKSAPHQATARRQMQGLTRMVDDLLDTSRITRGTVELRKERTSLAAIVHNATSVTRAAVEARGHRLEVTAGAGAFPVDADVTRIEQVVVNLLNNAIKYTDPGGTLSVRLDREGMPGAAEAVLRVRDSGRGIPADMLDGIFDLFVQVTPSLDRTAGGLGLGLTLVKRMVELHGGTVSAHSEGPGRGSEFVVRLPLAPEELPRTENVAVSAFAQPLFAGKRRLLVVEDVDDVRIGFQEFLADMGHEVATAIDGPEGVAKILELLPDVSFVDVGLPGFDGYEVARRVRASPGGDQLYLVALTGYGGSDAKAKVNAAGFNLHLTKPVDPGELAKLVSDARA